MISAASKCFQSPGADKRVIRLFDRTSRDADADDRFLGSALSFRVSTLDFPLLNSSYSMPETMF
jgi:hypothetical protein